MGRLGLVGYHMCAAALMLGYVMTTNLRDEYYRISKSTCADALARFDTTMVEVFAPQYLTKPISIDTQKAMAMWATRRWSRMLKSLDCMYLRRMNCTYAPQGQYQGNLQKIASFLKQLILNLVCPGLIMISICSSDLHCLLG